MDSVESSGGGVIGEGSEEWGWGRGGREERGWSDRSGVRGVGEKSGVRGVSVE